MEQVRTQTLPSHGEGLHRAAQILLDGGLVAFPTETVYGLGADARDDRAVARIFAAKGRPSFNPLIVHLPDVESARGYAKFNRDAERLAEAFWPGPLTLVLPVRPRSGLSPLVTAGLDTVGVRLPAHPVARALLSAFRGPLAAPSANRSGRVSATRPEHVLEGLGGRIEAVVDGGPCDVGIESTIVGLVGQPTLLRAGGIPVEALEACLGKPLATGGDASRPSAPGQLLSHYAPAASLRLEATEAGENEVWIGFGRVPGHEGLNLSATGDLTEAAARLFHLLRLADARAKGGRIAVAPVPDRGIGRAINDRLRRAAAPRD